ncbi:hypothetical protein B296_00015904 [Ensete ventricosum]|uniref:Uncharacterized protein n=1 Tax=Ensete ventricosum TaxID=4639 RepID=A0A426Z2T2_ENSVE|nr:hypothetical protein B296_00015904 [Ensete ventricosum]
MLHPGVTREWVGEGELPKERTEIGDGRGPTTCWQRPHMEKLQSEFITQEFVYNGDVTKRRYGAADLRLLQCLYSLRLREPDKSKDKTEGVEAVGRKGRGSDDEFGGTQLPKSKASDRKEVDSEECHSAVEADLLTAKKGTRIVGP